VEPAPLLDYRDVRVAHEGTVALSGLSLTVPPTGITVVVGASGSGKSTLLRCAVRLEEPERGEILVDGERIRSVDPRALRRRLAFVFQRPTLFPGTVLENLRLADDTLDRAGADELLEAVGLDAAMTARVADTLSGGEAQRVCLARALATRPRALLADEPTSALDRDAADEVEAQILRLAASGMPVVWVTHDPAQVARLADHLVVLDHGRLRYSGDPDGIPDEPTASAP
jgi:putative ABC transport system ATP-binding protein